MVGGALVVPIGLVYRLQGKTTPQTQMFAKETRRVEQRAMDAVMAAETALGNQPRDVSSQKCGYDIESFVTATGKLRFIEVKGRIQGAETMTVTKNEILTALNTDDYILAIVEVPSSEEFIEADISNIYYTKQPFQREPDFGVTSVNYSLNELKQRSHKPF